MSFLDDAISSVGRGLAQSAVGALSDATGYDVGGTLNMLFGKDQPTGGADLAALATALQTDFSGTPEQLQMLQSGLDQQTQMLSDLGGQIAALASSIAVIEGQIANIEALLQQIGQEQLYQDWSLIDSKLTDYLSAIQTGYATYGEYLADFSTIDTSLVSELAVDILDTNTGPRVGLTAIAAHIRDDGQQRGVLQLWSNMVAPLVTAGIIDYRDAVSQYCAYYQKLAYAQLQATNLVMEAYNFRNTPKEAAQVWSDYRAHLLEQEPVFLNWLVPLVWAGVAGGTLVPQGGNQAGWCFSACDASLQLNPGLQRLPGSQGHANMAYYSPSEVFRQAEDLLATLYVTGESDRRIVVHMLFDAALESSGILSGVELSLEPVGDGASVNPATSLRLGGPYSIASTILEWVPDLNLYTSGFYIKRYVFKADASDQSLADGAYQISNINGTQGLVPMNTYLSSVGNARPQFMNDNVLAWTVAVGESQPFDFMNFMAYMIPVRMPWGNN